MRSWGRTEQVSLLVPCLSGCCTAYVRVRIFGPKTAVLARPALILLRLRISALAVANCNVVGIRVGPSCDSCTIRVGVFAERFEFSNLIFSFLQLLFSQVLGVQRNPLLT